MPGTRDHWIDTWTREASLAALAPEEDIGRPPVLADLGCSSGHLLADLAVRVPDATLIGVDAIPEGLARASVLAPRAILCHASVTELPIDDGALDGVLALNLLEHVPDDELALREIARVLRPGGRGVIVVPRGPELFDCYDQALQHERRYAGGELGRKSTGAGLRARDRILLGSAVFPGILGGEEAQPSPPPGSHGRAGRGARGSVDCGHAGVEDRLSGNRGRAAPRPCRSAPAVRRARAAHRRAPMSAAAGSRRASRTMTRMRTGPAKGPRRTLRLRGVRRESCALHSRAAWWPRSTCR